MQPSEISPETSSVLNSSTSLVNLKNVNNRTVVFNPDLPGGKQLHQFLVMLSLMPAVENFQIVFPAEKDSLQPALTIHHPTQTGTAPVCLVFAEHWASLIPGFEKSWILLEGWVNPKHPGWTIYAHADRFGTTLMVGGPKTSIVDMAMSYFLTPIEG